MKKILGKKLDYMFVSKSFGRKIIRDGGDVVSIPITEIEIRPRKTIFVIMELDSAGYIDLLSNGSGKHYEYKNTWTTKYQGLYHKVSGYTLGDKKSTSPDNKTSVRSILNFGVLKKYKFTVTQTKHYYFIMKSRSPCYLHIDDQELIVS